MKKITKLVVLDFETVGKNPDTTDPCQLGAIVIDLMTLQPIPNAEFNSYMRPDEKKIDPSTLEWHAKIKQTTTDKILELWRNAPTQKQVWTDFANWVNTFNNNPSKPSMFGGPILGGYNILEFDCPIVERLSQAHGTVDKDGKCNLFFRRDKLDLLKQVWWWFEGNPEVESYTLDSIRDYFGITKDGGHDALKDVRDTGLLITKFIKLHRTLAPKVKFKGSLINV